MQRRIPPIITLIMAGTFDGEVKDKNKIEPCPVCGAGQHVISNIIMLLLFLSCYQDVIFC